MNKYLHMYFHDDKNVISPITYLSTFWCLQRMQFIIFLFKITQSFIFLITLKPGTSFSLPRTISDHIISCPIFPHTIFSLTLFNGYAQIVAIPRKPYAQDADVWWYYYFFFSAHKVFGLKDSCSLFSRMQNSLFYILLQFFCN